MAFHRPWHRPFSSRLRGKSKKTVIIFGIADQDHRFAIPGIGQGEHRLHQHLPNAVALTIGAYRNGPHEHESHCALIMSKLDGPALDRSDQLALVDCRQTQVRYGVHALAQPIGGPATTIGPERMIEQQIDGFGRNVGDGDEMDQFG